MGIVRIKKHSDMFVILDRGCLENRELSFRAKGLWTYLMSLPDDWVVNIADLSKRSREGRDAVQGAMAELMKSGYVKRELARKDDGSLDGWDYTIYEVPPDGWQTADGFSADGEKATTKEPKKLNNHKTYHSEHLQRMFHAWRDKVGPDVPRSRIAKAFNALASHYSADDITEGWALYLAEIDNPRYASPATFSTRAKAWIGRGAQRPIFIDDIGSVLEM